ncbi:hypothetical protein PFICI_07553 [Pestalotiopsis fici W106-1]|uniref:Protein kinase domain-containing protein n=1 Tax=Pestalotiopsis fici (strain W106-1 / CGMCC3.15140) TaxID=1229662 RepID=W3X1Y2_PESFW|nr:uncharacterized protein PFICI_07553 [Pestalotiopsis fici W106-1]ETS80024.1 hypothetical protein PFICI_07553 [Pestalotiopsis fici W106-1]
MQRKRKLSPSHVIHDLSTLIEWRITRQIHDGTKRKRASLYLIEARPAVDGQQLAEAQRTSKDCKSETRPPRDNLILKIFPDTRACEDDYNREVAANAELGRSSAIASPITARDAMFGNISNSDLRWPRCYGTMKVPANVTEGEWTIGESSSEARRGIIFEYLVDLKMLQKDDVTEDLANEIKQLFTDLHALKLLHRDHINHAIWPLIGFNNLFLQRDDTGKKKLYILDFDKALVLGDTARDKSRFADEANRLQQILEQATSKQDETKDLPAEVKRLLAGRGG